MVVSDECLVDCFIAFLMLRGNNCNHGSSKNQYQCFIHDGRAVFSEEIWNIATGWM